MELIQPTLGTDLEFFLKDCKGRLTPSGKHLPYQTTNLHYSPFTDGFQGEITTEFGKTVAEATLSVQKAVSALKMLTDSHLLRILLYPAVKVPSNILLDCPDNVFEFGCAPSVNAYTHQTRDREMITALHGPYHDIMMAGGHVHIGLGHEALRLRYADVVRCFESIAVTLLTCIEYKSGKPRINKLRRLFYGLSGEFRLKPYGVEARSPSCIWMSTPELVQMIYSAATIAVNMVYYGLHLDLYGLIPIDYLTTAINDSNLEACRDIYTTAFSYANKCFGVEAKHLLDSIEKAIVLDISDMRLPQETEVFNSWKIAS